MKARVKATGEIVDVYERYDDLAMETVFEELAGSYRPDELDFSVDEEKEAEGAVISGWVARDNGGFISLFSYCPDRVIHDDLGFWGHNDGSHEIDMPQDSFPSLTWDDDPIEVEITIKPKKKSSTK